MTEDIRLDSLEGVGPVTTKKLSGAGVHSIMDLIVRGPVEIADITGMEKDTADRIVNKAREHLESEGLLKKSFESATEIYKRRQDIGKITTGTNCLDSLLDGGVETQALTEVYGEYGCGKTQFCHSLCVQVQRSKEEGGLDGSVLYIDTENTFRPERIVSIANANGMDPEKVLDRIIVARAYNSAHQTLILEESGPVIKEHNVKLLIADSAVGLFRAEYLGRGTLSARQQKLNHFVHMLSRIAETYNCAAVATNQVMASPDVFFGDPTRPVGGNVVAHTSTYRIYFKKSGKKRIARMVDSPHHPEEEVIFALGEAGVIDLDSDVAKKTKKTITPKKTIVKKTETVKTKSKETTDAPKADEKIADATEKDTVPDTTELKDKIPDTTELKDTIPDTTELKDKIPDTTELKDTIPDTTEE